MGFDCLLPSFKASILGPWTKERDVYISGGWE